MVSLANPKSATYINKSRERYTEDVEQGKKDGVSTVLYLGLEVHVEENVSRFDVTMDDSWMTCLYRFSSERLKVSTRFRIDE